MVAADGVFFFGKLDRKPNWRIGSQLGLLNALFMRFGYYHDADGIWDLTYGWGLGYDARKRLGVRLDFATLPPAVTPRRRDQYTLSGWLKI